MENTLERCSIGFGASFDGFIYFVVRIHNLSPITILISGSARAVLSFARVRSIATAHSIMESAKSS